MQSLARSIKRGNKSFIPTKVTIKVFNYETKEWMFKLVELPILHRRSKRDNKKWIRIN